MSYYLADANGYLEDFASIGGLRDFAVWAAGVGGTVSKFVRQGYTEDPVQLAYALDKASAQGDNEELRLALKGAATRAEAVIILSDGTSGEDLRAAEFHEDQPRDEHGMWTAGGNEEYRGEGRGDSLGKRASDPNAAAVQDYTGDSAPINNALRNETEVPKGYQETVKLLDAQMKPSENEQVLSRLVENEHLENLKVGDVYTDKGYVSTSKTTQALKEIADDLEIDSGAWSTLSIRAPKGTPSIDVNKVNPGGHYAHQKEVILARGLKYRVTNKNGNNFWVTVVK